MQRHGGSTKPRAPSSGIRALDLLTKCRNFEAPHPPTAIGELGIAVLITEPLAERKRRRQPLFLGLYGTGAARGDARSAEDKKERRGAAGWFLAILALRLPGRRAHLSQRPASSLCARSHKKATANVTATSRHSAQRATQAWCWGARCQTRGTAWPRTG